MCLARGDDYAMEVYGRLQGLNDLVSEEAMYCKNCHRDLSRPPKSREVQVSRLTLISPDFPLNDEFYAKLNLTFILSTFFEKI